MNKKKFVKKLKNTFKKQHTRIFKEYISRTTKLEILGIFLISLDDSRVYFLSSLYELLKIFFQELPVERVLFF